MRSAYKHIVGLTWKHALKGRPRTYEIYVEEFGNDKKIGFYTISHVQGGLRFYDGINIVPEYDYMWRSIAEMVLKSLPDGEYEYGWQWNIANSKYVEISSLPGVEILDHRPILIQGVEFSKWPDWNAYYKDISENIRRNIKKTIDSSGNISIKYFRGYRSIFQIGEILSLRYQLAKRKGLEFNYFRLAVAYILSILTCPSQSELTQLDIKGRPVSIQNMSQFGDTTYYLDGASLPEFSGAGWVLQLETMKRAYERDPKGVYLLGYTDVEPRGPEPEGLLRSRRSLRATEWSSSLISFRWSNLKA